MVITTSRSLLDIAQRVARRHYDGHITMLRFTSGWKVAFGTVTERDEIASLEAFASLDDALADLIANECDPRTHAMRGSGMDMFRDALRGG